MSKEFSPVKKDFCSSIEGLTFDEFLQSTPKWPREYIFMAIMAMKRTVEERQECIQNANFGILFAVFSSKNADAVQLVNEIWSLSDPALTRLNLAISINQELGLIVKF